MIITRTVAGSAAVTLAQAKAHCRVDHDDEDSLITGLVSAAQGVIAERIGRVLTEETWTVATASACGDLVIPVRPVRSIEAITYFDAAGTSQSLTVSDFLLFSHPERPVLRPKPGVSWPALQPREDALTVELVAGMTTVPAELAVAVMMLAAHWYRNREAVITGVNSSELPLAVEAICDLHVAQWIAA